MTNLSWQHVVVIGMCLGAIVAVAALGSVDMAVMVGVAMMILVGIGVIRQEVNGRISQLIKLVETALRNSQGSSRRGTSDE